jgi:hypothetical protein
MIQPRVTGGGPAPVFITSAYWAAELDRCLATLAAIDALHARSRVTHTDSPSACMPSRGPVAQPPSPAPGQVGTSWRDLR